MTSGLPYENGAKSEVIDLANPEAVCQLLPNFPDQIYASTGGLINNETPLICGGSRGGGDGATECFTIGKTEETTGIVTKMLESRLYPSSVVLDDRLWIYGGRTDTSEFVYVDGRNSEFGPDVPEGIFDEACMVRISDTEVVIIGGGDNDGLGSETHIYDTTTNQFTRGPDMLKKRVGHSCSLFEYQGERYVLAVSGYTSKESSEYWNPKSDQGWIEGPILDLGPDEPPCFSKTNLLSSQYGTVLIGCNNANGGKIFQLIEDGEENLSWSTMTKTLEYPKHETVAMFIPDEMANCS